MIRLRLSVFILGIILALQSFIISCSEDSEGFFFGALGLNEGRILVVNGLAAPVQYTITMYDLTGKYLGLISDTSNQNAALRGLAYYDGLHVIVSQDGPDQLSLLNLFSGELTEFATNALFAGNVYDVRGDGAGSYYVAETNTVEKFYNGARIPVSGATPYVNTTLGSCVISTARGVTMTNNGRLVVVSNANDDVLVYDVTGASSATCYTAYTGFAGTVNPIDAVGHSNGNIYITGNGSNIVYESPDANPLVPVQIFSNVGILSAPSAIAELPNGNLIVAGDTNDTIVEITTTGTVVNASFIRNAFSSSVFDILVIPPQ